MLRRTANVAQSDASADNRLRLARLFRHSAPDDIIRPQSKKIKEETARQKSSRLARYNEKGSWRGHECSLDV
jgi:hypothetical protein